ncbi:uncharacterized protein LOC135386428 [Ornithodoros turicata]|uniref:uncharacterized protein LOC135386428 n=1 Tax=Ornithodoros turicata TaxID=34597 RepID=UPI00313995C7
MFCDCYNVSSLILVQSGDVELNPGPMVTEEQMSRLLDASAILTRLEVGQTILLNDIKDMKEKLHAADQAIMNLSTKIETIETELTSLKVMRTDISNIQLTSNNMSKHITKLENQIDDMENRMRRSNLIFYGITDIAGESWAQSEAKVIELCSEKLNVSVSHDEIERAHRLGRHRPERHRPIIVKLKFYKRKEEILSLGHRLKQSGYSIIGDYSLRVRKARSQLLAFAKSIALPFKLKYDKLLVDNKCYRFNESN